MSIQAISAPAARGPERTAADAVAAPPAARAPAAAVDTAIAVEKTAKAPPQEQLDQAVANINKTLQDLSQDLEFSVDKDSNRTIVKVVDQKTKEVIRQIPSPEALEIAKALDTVRGLLIKQTA
ncbi:MAG TPA: flagellar protein FlaG [Telluria sp.]|nr:flagellar protein FlaG [Telluria sp.]